MLITRLDPTDTLAIQQAAEALVAGFVVMAPNAWPDLDAAIEEVHQALHEQKLCLAARDDEGRVHGWIGGQHAYARVWELHPLVVHPRSQGQGIGRSLVATLEHEVRQRGGLTMLLGTDDETDMTTLSGVDLYQDTWAHVTAIRNLKGHPFEFYLKCGYKIVGVVPDANGYGRPDILMARRL
ncbi:MAG: GNAT family N-acetyltransferase [Anaerolineae bacterium]|nr:GNAT family N-acetyltransferase [Anaerolineae bacterium]